MQTATLTLAPDEVLPSTPAPLTGEAFGPVTLSLGGEKREFRLRLVELMPRKYMVFARQVGNEDAENWLFYSRPNLSPFHFNYPLRTEEAEKTMCHWDSLKHGLGRFFYFCDPCQDEPTLILLGDNGVGTWLSSSSGIGWGRDFEFPLEASKFENNRADVREWLKGELAALDSPISFVKRWKDLTPTGKCELALDGHLGEIKEVMSWALMCEARCWPRNSHWRWVLKLFNPRKDDNWSNLIHQGSRRVEDLKADFPFLYEMGRFLNDDYIKKIATRGREKHLCIRNSTTWMMFEVGAEIQLPSSHEQIEAALQLRQWLRQWLRQNQAPPEIEALLAL